MTSKERFIDYLKEKGLGQTAFEKSAGLSRGQIAQKVGFSAATLEKIAAACPDLNLEWLITGEGEMLKLPSSTESPATINSHNANSHINDGGTIDRLLALLEEKDRQINQLLQIISGLSK